MLLGAIADDLTGATDLALILSREGMNVVQVNGLPNDTSQFGDADAVIIALKSRTIEPEAAIKQSIGAAKLLLEAGAKQLFFKYCSTFDSTDKGNIGPVTDALLKLVGESRTIACPAFPANGRTVFQGHLFVGNQLLSESPLRDHPLTPMCDPNLVRVLQRQSANEVSLVAHQVVASGADTIADVLAELNGIAIVDAIDDMNLRAIGRAVRDLKLVTGGSAVAQGLPENFRMSGLLRETGGRSETPIAIGGGVILAGSCSAATRRQIETAKVHGVPSMQLNALDIAGGKTTPGDVIAFVRSHRDSLLPPLVYSSAEPDIVALAQEELGRETAGLVVEKLLGEVAAGLSKQGYNRFIIAGGETSGAVVQALGAEAFWIGREIDPGVPLVTSAGEGPVRLALKSGNFGSDEFFIKAWEMMA
ncbi:four-carbon acid sugar kinase family protein [Brucella pseudogrignonensis]|uniref:3-oxo-tetronate kinase n=1 Tax=Brucella pseudogrignonensis TaxID=419475 RepID=UPI0028B9FD3D|nr:3-oxo-tetronate kinase [Brucella pseudogrignonensis]MDT6941710.1 four-carbon acid sugar kinase family protein [Brucella pseudogrignonensis]